MKRGEWHGRARELAATGMGCHEISRALGVTHSAVWKVLNPERAREYNRRSESRPQRKTAKRAWDRDNYRGECEICGATTWKRKTRCQRHSLARDAAWRRRREIADRWAAGESLVEIAEALDTTWKSIAVDMTRMRRDGWDLPYRYNMKDGKRVAA